MRRATTLFLALAASGAALHARPAAAEIVELARAGAWRALGGTADNGRALCGAAEVGPDGRSFMIRFVEGAPAFEVLLTKPSWRIPRGTQVQVAVTFDQLGPWNGRANGNGDALVLSVPRDRLRPFLLEFMGASRVYFRFPEGSEAPWQGNMAGSRAITARLADCIGALRQARGRQEEDASQPYSGGSREGGSRGGSGSDHDIVVPRTAPPSQPFGGGGGLKD